MAFATMATSGDATARWSANVSRVVVDIRPGDATVLLSSGEAWALAAQLMAAADEADVIDTSAA